MTVLALVMANVCAVPMLCAQQTATPVLSLKTTSIGVTAASNIYVNANDDPVCDVAGNVYVRIERPGDKLALLPILRITREGKWGGIFPAPGSTAGLVRGVFVTPEGVVYRLVAGGRGTPPKYADKGYHVREYALDGSVKADTPLGLEPNVMEPWHLAVFRSGGFLVAGATREQIPSAFTAVFAPDGKLVKRIYEPEDEQARLKGQMEWRQGAMDAGDNYALSSGLAAGSDGNVYLLRGVYPTHVDVVSPAGEVVRKLRIDTGNPDLRAHGIEFYDGHLAIGFDRMNDGEGQLVKVIDLEGKGIADYSVGAGLEESRLACYGPEGFTMVSDGPNPLLLRAKP